MINELVYYDEITQSLSKAVYHANANLKNAVGLLRMAICDGMWRKRMVTMTGEVVEFKKFEQFVTAQPPEGLGADMATLKYLCASEPELLALIERAEEIYPIQRAETKEVQPKRFSKEWTIDRLEKAGRLDLIKKINKGKLSVFGAQVEMGWRKRENQKSQKTA